MRGFLALVRKECRDGVAPLAMSALLAAALSWIVQRWVLKFEEPAVTAEWVVPGVLGIGLAIVASDLFSQDVATGRMAAFALLPTRTSTLWLARMTYLALAGALLFAWGWLVQIALLRAFGKPELVIVFSTQRSSLGVAMACLAGALTAMCSSIGLGGFRAATMGIGLPMAAYVVATKMRIVLPSTQDWTHVVTAAGATFTAASLFGFVRGGAAIGRRFAPAIWAMGFVVAVAAPSAAWAAMAIHDEGELRLTDDRIGVRSIRISPDETHLIVLMERWPGSGEGITVRPFVVRRADGRVFDWPTSGTWGATWTGDSKVWTSPSQDEYALDASGRFYEPVNGGRIREVDGTLVRIAAIAERAALERGPAPGEPAAPASRWRTTKQPPSVTGTWTFVRIADGRESSVWSRVRPIEIGGTDEVMVLDEKGTISSIDRATGARRVVAEIGTRNTVPDWAFSDDRRFVVVTFPDGRGKGLFETTSWKELRHLSKDAWWGWVKAPGGAFLAWVDDPDRAVEYHLFEPTTQREVEFPRTADFKCLGADGIVRLSDGSFVIACSGGKVCAFTRDGRFERTIFAPVK